jgi:hypothetical protein
VSQQRALLVFLNADGPLTGNEVGMGMVRLGHVIPSNRRHSHNGKYMGEGSMVAPVLTSLRRRGLTRGAPRPDGLSGSADVLTDAGAAVARAINRSTLTPTPGGPTRG